MAFDYPRSNGYQVGTDFDGSELHQANFLSGQINLSMGNKMRLQRFFRCGDSLCARCGDSVTTFAVDPHNALFNRDQPHLYSIECRVQSPWVGNGRNACKWVPPLPGFPGRWACDGVDQAHYSAEVAAEGSLAFLDHSGNPIDSGFESTPASGPTPTGAIYSPFWPDAAIYDPGVGEGSQPVFPGFAYLENPDPVWPVPDAQGSTFGRVLWELDQIPWEISVTFAHHNHEHPLSQVGLNLQGHLNCTVRGYLLSRRINTIATVEAGPGLAGIRSRGRIVGNRAPGITPS